MGQGLPNAAQQSALTAIVQQLEQHVLATGQAGAVVNLLVLIFCGPIRIKIS